MSKNCNGVVTVILSASDKLKGCYWAIEVVF
jgi:hypothetical protein